MIGPVSAAQKKSKAQKEQKETSRRHFAYALTILDQCVAQGTIFRQVLPGAMTKRFPGEERDWNTSFHNCLRALGLTPSQKKNVLRKGTKCLPIYHLESLRPLVDQYGNKSAMDLSTTSWLHNDQHKTKEHESQYGCDIRGTKQIVGIHGSEGPIDKPDNIIVGQNSLECFSTAHDESESIDDSTTVEGSGSNFSDQPLIQREAQRRSLNLQGLSVLPNTQDDESIRHVSGPQNKRKRVGILQSAPLHLERSPACRACFVKKRRCTKLGTSCMACNKNGIECQPRDISSSASGVVDAGAAKQKKANQASDKQKASVVDGPIRATALDGTSYNDPLSNHGGIPVIDCTTVAPRQSQHPDFARIQRQLDEEREKTRLFSDYLSSLLSQRDPKRSLTADEEERMRYISRAIMEYRPHELFRKLRKRLEDAEKKEARMQKTLDTLLRDVCLPNDHSPVSFVTAADIDEQWKYLRRQLRISIEIERSLQLPSVDTLAKLAETILFAFHNSCIGAYLPPWLLQNGKDELQNDCVVQSIVGTLFCHHLFVEGKIIGEQEYTGLASKLFTVIETKCGLSSVKALDTFATKLLTEDKQFKEGKAANEVVDLTRRLLKSLNTTFSQIPPRAIDESNLSHISGLAMKLKTDMTINPTNYSIMYLKPGTAFDPKWMDVEDEDGHPLQLDPSMQGKVRLCLFPAIEQHPIDLTDVVLDDVTSVLNCNKTFKLGFFDSAELTHEDQIVSKAIVLLV